MPTISKKNGILKCNYNKMSFQKGPFCPEFYSEPIKLKIMSLIDEEIQAEIEEIPDEGEDDNEKDEEIEVTEKEILEDFNEKINVIDRHDIDLYKYMKVKKNFLAKEPIEVEIYIPNLISKDKKEIQKIKRLLKLKAGTSECKIIIEMNIITVPLQILFSCENYQLQYINENFYLKTEQLLSGEIIQFKIQNYIEGENLIIQTRIDSLDNNNSNIPIITFKKDTVEVEIPKMTQIKRLNCKIECYISGNYNIPIIIDSVIIPNDFDFEIYDFSKHCFNNKIDLFIPSIYKNK